MINIKARHLKCPIPTCGASMFPTENGNWVCNPCGIIFFIKMVGKANKDNEVNRIGGMK